MVRAIVNVHGPWLPLAEFTVEEPRQRRIPEPIVNTQSILEARFELTEEQVLPYGAFDALRLRRSVDLTGFDSSMTRRGNMYRAAVLMRGVQIAVSIVWVAPS